MVREMAKMLLLLLLLGIVERPRRLLLLLLHLRIEHLRVRIGRHVLVPRRTVRVYRKVTRVRPRLCIAQVQTRIAGPSVAVERSVAVAGELGRPNVRILLLMLLMLLMLMLMLLCCWCTASSLKL